MRRSAPSGGDSRASTPGIRRKAAGLALGPALTTLVALLAAGRLAWVWPWVYAGISAFGILVLCAVTTRIEPVPSGRAGAASTGTGSRAAGLLSLPTMSIVLPLTAGLDERFAWPGGFSPVCRVGMCAGLAAGLALRTWAAAANPYSWSDAAVQRGQSVCTAGPYRFIRHPAYAGAVIQALVVPVLFGSVWAVVPGIAVCALMVTVTSREDRALQDELPAYREYSRRVRFRLLPGIW